MKTMKRKKTNRRAQFLSGILFINLLLGIGCGGNQSLRKTNSNAAAANENKVSVFESDLQTMRTAGLEYIFVFRRKDGGVFDCEDRKY